MGRRFRWARDAASAPCRRERDRYLQEGECPPKLVPRIEDAFPTRAGGRCALQMRRNALAGAKRLGSIEALRTERVRVYQSAVFGGRKLTRWQINGKHPLPVGNATVGALDRSSGSETCPGSWFYAAPCSAARDIPDNNGLWSRKHDSAGEAAVEKRELTHHPRLDLPARYGPSSCRSSCQRQCRG